MKKFALFFLVAYFFAASQVLAMGLSVSPSSVSLQSTPGTPASARITVTNTSGRVALFEVYPDDMRSAFTVMPESFTLEAGASKEVELRMKGLSDGKYRTDISVTATPVVAEGFRAGAGIKVPYELSVGGKPNLLAAVSSILKGGILLAAVVVILAAIMLSYVLRRRIGRDLTEI